MIVEIKVPELGESINEVEIGEWLVEIGSRVELDDELVALESDKATVELPSPNHGVVVEILKQQGESAAIGEAIARIDTDIAEGSESGQPADAVKEPEESTLLNEEAQQEREGAEEAASVLSSETTEIQPSQDRSGTAEGSQTRVMPAASRILAQHDIAPEAVKGTGPGGRILKEDALRAVAEKSTSAAKPEGDTPATGDSEATSSAQSERRVRMTPIRRAIATRLLQAKQEMALLTTFNEVDMSAVKNARRVFGPEFEKKFGVRLGFMSFFVKAAVSALIDYPLVNARIEESDIVYHDSCDIGVAIGGGKGLVVPVLRRAERLGFAEIEQKIGEFAEKAKNNKLTMEELQGGTFTISNGGVYGSMLSTPIVNPPQSAILGLHAIKDRPVAVDGEVLIRPIMYLALSYDHRIIDGREAVSFLKSIKERIEEPQKLLLEI